ncbi:STAM-binding protein [Ceratobasidium sp. AG-Ba]|nr:STAM-binding protein [Ceratobasidium sp. AG-Ba]
MSSRRPFSIQELAARSRPTGYDASKSLKDLLRIATAERNAGDQAKDAGDVESAFIHYAKASTLMLEDLPTHPKFAELTSSQKDAVVVHGQAILDSLGAVKRLVSQRFSDWRTEHPDADLSAPVAQPQQPRRRQTQPTHQPRDTYEEARRAQQQKEARRLVEEQERRQRRAARDAGAYDQVAALTTTRRDATAAPYDQVANITAARIREKQDKDRLEKEKLEELKRAQEAAFLGYPTPVSIRPRPDSYESQAAPVSVQPQQPPPPLPPQSAPPVSIPQPQHLRSVPQRTGSAARVYPSHPPTTQPPTQPPTRTGSRAEVHRPGSRAEHRPQPPTIRTDVFGVRNESAPAAYGPGQRPRRPSMSSPVKDRPPPGASFAYGAHPPTTGPGSHPPTTQAPVPRRRTSSHTATGRPPGFPVASAYQGGTAVGIGVGLDSRPNGGSFDSRANGSFDARQNTSFDSRPNGSFDARQNGSFDARPNGGSFDARASGQSFESRASDPHAHARPSSDTRANGVFPAQPAQMPMPQDILPLESPSHSWRNEPEEMPVHAPAPRRNAHGHQPVRGSSYPPPVTTTSPPPGPISYPDLMSSSRRARRSGIWSDQDDDEHSPGSSLSTQSRSDSTRGRAQPLPNPHESSPSKMYAGPGTSSGGVPTYPGMPQPRAPQSNYATRPPPAVPPKDYTRAPPPPPPQPDSTIPPLPSTSNSPAQQPDEPEDGKLRQVLLPEEVIQKFMSIAKPNTLQNRETCGLLLGKKRGPGYAVTTLLIPRQRATSDTCEMVEEELIMEFQESRELITLGWIHTHPTQSCFMSSLDLHTHSGYQASLKEAFAIVCAPSQSPNVGIFRLTDPPGLQTILKCTIKESFHPHTASNIYTDADQGHVKMMKKLDLSIVDLRRHSN